MLEMCMQYMMKISPPDLFILQTLTLSLTCSFRAMATTSWSGGLYL